MIRHPHLYPSLFPTFSPNGIFSAGFHSVGENAYCFSIWFTEPTSDGNLTAIWMANRDQPEDNLIRLLFPGPYISAVYWPDPWLNSWQVGRTLYNDSRIAAFDSSGLRMDVGGNVRLYSLDEERRIWRVSWQAISQPCKIHGVCGPNAMCNYDYLGGILVGDALIYSGTRQKTLQIGLSGVNQSPPSLAMLSNPVSSNFLTLNSMATISIPMKTTPWKGVRKYAYKTVNATASFSRIAANLVFTVVIRSHGCLKDLDPRHLGLLSTFWKFTYDKLKKATGKFREEIGRGGGGVVRKGILSDRRVAAIKRLNKANQGEAKLLAEVSTIGRVNHMNLIEIWGYCVEGNHRLLVYEYMERGSLAENLISGTLDWVKRFDIAVGSAKKPSLPTRRVFGVGSPLRCEASKHSLGL
ncbi:hypothetical protein RHSIM_RhsimUnG0047000 [Rhododendron simsii]|uniref:non-specific serine/threonine protein kinase n=1 Tax=Rhododendron simsii TaxID=118357 RepID=A0A834L2X1_RHOSS|nr:hypothetical protein RHSIM_RhsimUnG0047000 [Rhododendron simsii]